MPDIAGNTVGKTNNADTTNSTESFIVLVHGIGGNRVVMWPLAARLRRAGFRVENWGYSSLFADIGSHAARLAERLKKLDADESVHEISLVGHSMGCIVCRAALDILSSDSEDGLSPKINAAVLLTPPNCGSPRADFFCPNAELDFQALRPVENSGRQLCQFSAKRPGDSNCRDRRAKRFHRAFVFDSP